MTTDHHTKPCLCPNCGNFLDAATQIGGDAKPDPGDISVCIECAAILQFGDDLALTIFPEDELKTLPKNIQAMLIQAVCAVGMTNELKKSAPQAGKPLAS